MEEKSKIIQRKERRNGIESPPVNQAPNGSKKTKIIHRKEQRASMEKSWPPPTGLTTRKATQRQICRRSKRMEE
jgi:hypothetical protein